jgi:hypothetical protein
MNIQAIQQRVLNSPMRSSYGEVILKKGTRLYHASADPLETLPNRPLLFTTLHPSDYYVGRYISVIELLRDVSLFFMVREIKQFIILSSLHQHIAPNINTNNNAKYLTQNQRNTKRNLKKQDYNNIRMWLPYLQAEQFDGWFSSIENRTAIEFAIVNDPSILKFVECSPIVFNWNIMYNSPNNVNYETYWGTSYPISTITLPAILILNKRYRAQINKYMSVVKKTTAYGTPFSCLIENATIYYVDVLIQPIHWFT